MNPKGSRLQHRGAVSPLNCAVMAILLERGLGLYNTPEVGLHADPAFQPDIASHLSGWKV